MAVDSVNIEYSGEIFLSELFHLSSGLVWKNLGEANRCEIQRDSIERETFMAAHKGLIDFNLIHQFDYNSLIVAGLTPEEADAGADSKLYIPESKRAHCAEVYVQELLKINAVTGRYVNYIETNDYYRMLAGLPSLDDIANDAVFYNKKYAKFPQNIPIHEMDLSDRYELESLGYFDEILKEHPTKLYLKYVGIKSIDFYRARSANRLDILWMPTSDQGNMQQDFEDIYSQNAYVVNSVYYSPAFSKSNDLYENFLALSVLFMTLQMMNYKYLEVDTSRDFYDTESLKYVYDSYGVPFYSSIPLAYHQKIVKQINQLLSYKGSTQVFFDLFDLFDLGTMDIYAYYLVKSRKFNANNTPVFAELDDGSPDKRAMYNIGFSKVKLYNDPALEIADSSNAVEYGSITNTDPYWTNDKELLDKIYDEKYNYTESKYIGVQTVFDVTKIATEYAYFFKLIQDNKKVTDMLVIDWDLLPNRVSLFDLFIYLAALYCKRYNFEGNISPDAPFVAAVMGFNFKENLTALIAKIANDKYIKATPRVVELLNGMTMFNLTTVNSVFENVMELKTLLSNKMIEAKSREEYYTFRDLYMTLMISTLMKDAYKMSNGEVAGSFRDLLRDTSPDLYNRWLTIDSTIDTEIKNVISLTEKNIPSLRYLENAIDLNMSGMIDNLFKILRFFKSAKAELVGYNIVYVLSSRGENFFKLIDKLSGSSINGNIDDDTILLDVVTQIDRYMDLKSEYMKLLYDGIMDRASVYKLGDYINKFADDIMGAIRYTAPLKDYTHLTDLLTAAGMTYVGRSIMKMTDANMLAHQEISYQEIAIELDDEIKILTDKLLNDPTRVDTVSINTQFDIIDKIVEIAFTVETALRANDINLFNDSIKDSMHTLTFISNTATLLIYDNLITKMFDTKLPDRLILAGKISSESITANKAFPKSTLALIDELNLSTFIQRLPAYDKIGFTDKLLDNSGPV